MNPPKCDLKDKRILVVEDFIFNQELMKDILLELGCQVDVADDGQQAVDLFKTKSYDLILMDVQMPRKDGYDSTREIRKLERNQQHTCIIALTAGALVEDREKCLAAGMDDYITKPVDLELLKDKIKTILKE